jgi:hypothetical protein
MKNSDEVKDAIELLSNNTVRIQILSDFAGCQYCSAALQTLIDFAQSQEVGVEEIVNIIQETIKIHFLKDDKFEGWVEFRGSPTYFVHELATTLLKEFEVRKRA